MGVKVGGDQTKAVATSEGVGSGPFRGLCGDAPRKSPPQVSAQLTPGRQFHSPWRALRCRPPQVPPSGVGFEHSGAGPLQPTRLWVYAPHLVHPLSLRTASSFSVCLIIVKAGQHVNMWDSQSM